MKIFTYEDGCQIKLLQDEKIIIKLHDELLEFNEVNKTVFTNDTGESVIEYSGLCVDGNQKRSWAKASYKPKAYSQLHYHQYRTEDYYIISGCAIVVIDNEKYHLTPGKQIQILPGKHHQVINELEEELKLIVSCTPSWILEDFHVVQANDLKYGYEKLSDKPYTRLLSGKRM